MTPEIVLLSRALEVDEGSAESVGAAVLFEALELHRNPRDPRDAMALRMWERLLPVLLRTRGDRQAFRAEALALGFSSLADQVVECPAWFRDRAEPTRELLALVNAGEASRWQLPTTPHSRRAPTVGTRRRAA